MRIGIINTAFIGDVVLTGLLIEGLHRAGHDIVLFTKSKTKLIFQYDLRVSKVVVLNKPTGIKKLFSFKTMVNQINHERLDVLLCPHRSLTTTLSAFFSNVKLTVGFANASFSWLYQEKRPYILGAHECLRFLNLITPTLCSSTILDDIKHIGRPILNLKIPSSKIFKTSAKPYFVLALGSVWNTKKYVFEYILEICEDILLNYPLLNCYLIGDTKDIPDCEKLNANLKNYSSRVINMAGKSSLIDLIEIVKNSKFVISNDSAPLHFASAYNIPAICFFGPTVQEQGFYSLSDKHLTLSHETVFGERLPCQPCDKHGAKKCPKKHHLCMKKMVPPLLMPKIRNFLNVILKSE